MVQFSSCLKFYSPLFQKSPSFKNPHFQHNAKCKLTFLVEITLIQKFLRFRRSAWDILGFCQEPQGYSCWVLFLPPFDHTGHLKSELHPLGNPCPLALSDISALCSKAYQQVLCHYAMMQFTEVISTCIQLCNPPEILSVSRKCTNLNSGIEYTYVKKC